MARTRNIKPGFATNEQLAELGPLAHLLFANLWPHCDREGRMEDRPRRIKVMCMPFYDCDVDELLTALAGGPEPFIERYEIDGKKYIQVLNWHKHQSPYTREPESVIPPCQPAQCKGTTKARRASCSGTKARNQNREQERELELEGGPGETATPDLSPFASFWTHVPNKIGRAAAESAYKAAVKALRERGQDDPHGFLLDRMAAFAPTPKAKGEFCPHPATWLNQGRYDDDPATWQQAGRGSPKAGNSESQLFQGTSNGKPNEF